MPPSDEQTLLVVGAHHDDNELNAGTITRHVQAGWRVVSVVATHGRYSQGSVNDANIEIRNDESRAAAKLLGVEPVFLGFDEGGFLEMDAARNALARCFRKHHPDIIITHPPHDYHADHMAVSAAVYDAWHTCVMASFDCEDPMLKKCPGLYYSDAWFVHFEPDLYVDVGEYMELKEQSLACHKSQLGPDGPAAGDMIDYERVRARYRGIEAGLQYAEAFRFVPRLGTVRTAELLA
jgi:LmbE family N-acetylglucosaminyl deacetylase